MRVRVNADRSVDARKHVARKRTSAPQEDLKSSSIEFFSA